jgi:hypothetical protein
MPMYISLGRFSREGMMEIKTHDDNKRRRRWTSNAESDTDRESHRDHQESPLTGNPSEQNQTKTALAPSSPLSVSHTQ